MNKNQENKRNKHLILWIYCWKKSETASLFNHCLIFEFLFSVLNISISTASDSYCSSSNRFCIADIRSFGTFFSFIHSYNPSIHVLSVVFYIYLFLSSHSFILHIIITSFTFSFFIKIEIEFVTLISLYIQIFHVIQSCLCCFHCFLNLIKLAIKMGIIKLF